MEEFKYEEHVGLVMKGIKKTFGSIESAAFIAKANSYDLEDYIQVGMIGLFAAREKFDESKNYKFSTFAMSYICGYLLKEIERNTLVKFPRSIQKEERIDFMNSIFSVNSEYVSLDKDIKAMRDVGESELLIRRTSLEEEVLSNLEFDRALNTLNEKNKQVVLMKLEGHSNIEISKYTGISTKMISKIFCNSKKKIAQHYTTLGELA
ncbi:RNA polymerase sigma factor [Bacillus phage G]|uniref:Gp69 n=1 Tax=Bacillus phage G TaxID=2884420 RepID=G3MBD9_9CAUD|nr:RNA polymerase sigma factor [Bacillus phage G]AEO93340.1 gp69 [Bacillus phage G]